MLERLIKYTPIIIGVGTILVSVAASTTSFYYASKEQSATTKMLSIKVSQLDTNIQSLTESINEFKTTRAVNDQRFLTIDAHLRRNDLAIEKLTAKTEALASRKWAKPEDM